MKRSIFAMIHINKNNPLPALIQRGRKKLKSKAGESLIETLASVMISVLGILMFAGAAASATRMITVSRSTLTAYYEQNNNLTEEKNGTAVDNAVKVDFTAVPGGAGGMSSTTDLASKQSELLGSILVYKNSKKTISSYRTSNPTENDPTKIDAEGSSETP